MQLRKPTATEWGVLGTVAWLIGGVLLLVFGKGRMFTDYPTDLNAWGDFAAGFFAPLAFLWLVLGYRQQGEELRAQAEELRQSVEAQKQLAAATQAQLEHEKQVYMAATTPSLRVRPLSANVSAVAQTFELRLSNDGADTGPLLVEWSYQHHSVQTGHWDHHSIELEPVLRKHHLDFRLTTIHPTEDIQVTIHTIDGRGQPYQYVFVYHPDPTAVSAGSITDARRVA